MEKLAAHFTERRQTTRKFKLNKITTSKRTCNTATKYKWYLKERHDMIRNLIIPDYKIHNILAIIGVIAFILLIQQLLMGTDTYSSEIVVVK